MFPIGVAQALRGEGYDAMRASETGQNRSDDKQILQKTISENRILVTLRGKLGPRRLNKRSSKLFFLIEFFQSISFTDYDKMDYV